MSRQQAGRNKGGKTLAENPQKKSEASRKAAAKQNMSEKGRKGGQASGRNK